jgi:phosphate transport system substrate-binding protein
MAAADQARWDAGASGFQLTDLPGRETWPIVGASYILVYRDQEDAGKAKAMLTYFDWCLKQGAGIASELGYIPLPKAAVSMVEASWRSEIRSGGRPVWSTNEVSRQGR